MRKGLCRSADVWNRKSQHGFLLWLELSDSVLFESNYVGEYKAVNTLSPHNIQNKAVFTERLGNDSGGVQYFWSSKKNINKLKVRSKDINSALSYPLKFSSHLDSETTKSTGLPLI